MFIRRRRYSYLTFPNAFLKFYFLNVPENKMGEIQHAFIGKPFYKRFHKCFECDKRSLTIPIVKCQECKSYCHRRCVIASEDAFHIDSMIPVIIFHDYNNALHFPSNVYCARTQVQREIKNICISNIGQDATFTQNPQPTTMEDNCDQNTATIDEVTRPGAGNEEP